MTSSGTGNIIRNGRVQELCESRGGRPGLPVLMSLTGSNIRSAESRSCVKVEVAVLGCPS